MPPFLFFFFNDTATPEIYTLSLHDALPILRRPAQRPVGGRELVGKQVPAGLDEVLAIQSQTPPQPGGIRSEEHTSELQSPCNLVCRLLLEKKKKIEARKPKCTRSGLHAANG